MSPLFIPLTIKHGTFPPCLSIISMIPPKGEGLYPAQWKSIERTGLRGRLSGDMIK